MNPEKNNDTLITSCLLERNISSEQAHTHIHSLIDAHGLVLRTVVAGSNLKTYQAFLTDEHLQKTFIGCGKGIGIQSEVSSLFEAFEHYMSYISLHKQELAIELSVKDNKDIQYLIQHHALPADFIDLIGGSHVSMPWVKLNSLHDDASQVHYPLFLLEPNYNHDNKFDYDSSSFHQLSHLSSTSGCASGTCFDEAVIHGLHEAIERDANSLFLYLGFIKQVPIRIVDKTTIPAYLNHHIQSIEHEYDDELVIIDMTTSVGVPSFCVTFTRHDAPIQPKGFGASLSRAYALERALLESLQPVHLRNDNLNRVERNTINRLEKYPLLQAAAIADIKPIIQENRFQLTSFDKIEDLYSSESLVEQKNKILALLQAQGCHAYYSKLYTREHYNLVHIIVSKLSNLFLLQTGKLILPEVAYFNARTS